MQNNIIRYLQSLIGYNLPVVLISSEDLREYIGHNIESYIANTKSNIGVDTQVHIISSYTRYPSLQAYYKAVDKFMNKLLKDIVPHSILVIPSMGLAQETLNAYMSKLSSLTGNIIYPIDIVPIYNSENSTLMLSKNNIILYYTIKTPVYGKDSLEIMANSSLNLAYQQNLINHKYSRNLDMIAYVLSAVLLITTIYNAYKYLSHILFVAPKPTNSKSELAKHILTVIETKNLELKAHKSAHTEKQSPEKEGKTFSSGSDNRDKETELLFMNFNRPAQYMLLSQRKVIKRKSKNHEAEAQDKDDSLERTAQEARRLKIELQQKQFDEKRNELIMLWVKLRPSDFAWLEDFICCKQDAAFVKIPSIELNKFLTTKAGLTRPAHDGNNHIPIHLPNGVSTTQGYDTDSGLHDRRAPANPAFLRDLLLSFDDIGINKTSFRDLIATAKTNLDTKNAQHKTRLLQ